MDTTERANVRRAVDELKPYLSAYVAQHAVSTAAPPRGAPTRGADIQALLRSMLDAWDEVFRRQLPAVARSYVHELIDIRNRWAHEEPFFDSSASSGPAMRPALHPRQFHDTEAANTDPKRRLHFRRRGGGALSGAMRPSEASIEAP
jgi:hypothetical protein